MSEPSATTDSAARKPRSNLAIRLLTAAVGVPLILWLLYLAPPWAFLIVVMAATALAASELMAMVVQGSRLLAGWGVIATVGLQIALLFLPNPRILLTTTVGIVIAGMVVSLASPAPLERAAQRTAWLVAGPLYVGGLLSTLIMLHRHDNGGSWVVLAMMLSWFGDTGAYFVGTAFGRTKLYPTISPKKTVEGSIGGLVGSAIGALLAHFWYLPELPLTDALVLAVLAGALGQAGDLCESLIKRSVGVKDSGRLIPGHGGLLDRVDALMFTSAATWLYTWWMLD